MDKALGREKVGGGKRVEWEEEKRIICEVDHHCCTK